MSSDHMDTTTPGYLAFAACREHHNQWILARKTVPEFWASFPQASRDAWHKAAAAARADLTTQIASMQAAIENLTEGHPPVALDYTNHEGVRGVRRVKPLLIDYGTTDWHPEPGFLMPCWDMDRGAYRIYSLGGFHAWNGQPVDDTEARLRAENLELRKELAAMTERYTSAVTLKPAAREAFGKLREAMEALRVETMAVLEASPPEHRAVPASEPTLNLPAESFLADAERICGQERVLSQFAAPAWDEFNEDGRMHVAAIVREAKAEAYAEVEAATGAVANSADLGRLAASQWYSAQGYRGFDWNGLTVTQQHAWHAVVDFLRSPRQAPEIGSVNNEARIKMIKNLREANAVVMWSDGHREVIGKVDHLTERLDGSAHLRVLVWERQGLTWTPTARTEGIEVHLLTSIGSI